MQLYRTRDGLILADGHGGEWPVKDEEQAAFLCRLWWHFRPAFVVAAFLLGVLWRKLSR